MSWVKTIFYFMLLGAAISSASAQTSCGFQQGQVLTAVELNACSQQKQNYPIPSLPLALARTRLSANTTIYVSTVGVSSTCSGQGTSACPSVQAAWNYAANNFDLDGFQLIISVADGTYTTPFATDQAMVGANGQFNVAIVGDCTTPANVIMNISAPGVGAFLFGLTSGVPMTTVECMQITNTGTGGHVIEARNAGTVVVPNNIIYGGADTGNSGAMIFVRHGAQLLGSGNGVTTGLYTVSGNAEFMLRVETGGHAYFDGAVFTCTGNPAFTVFAWATEIAELYAGGDTFTGCSGVTGQRYNVSLNSVINTVGGGATFFPGNSGGAAATGGQYN